MWQHSLDNLINDRICLAQLALESDRERLAAERAAFDVLRDRLVAASNRDNADEDPLAPASSIASAAKRIRHILAAADPPFVPLEFDDLGNSREASLKQLADLVTKVEEEKDKTSQPSLPQSSAVATRVQKVEPSEGEEEEEWPEFENSMSSPGFDIANVVVEEEEEEDAEDGGGEEKGVRASANLANESPMVNCLVPPVMTGS